VTVDAALELALRCIAMELEGNRVTPDYRRIVARDAKRFFSWLETERIEDLRNVGKAELLAYYRYVCSLRSTAGTRTVGEPLGAGMIRQIMAAAKKACTALYRSGYLTTDPFYGLDLGLPAVKTTRRPFTETQMTEFLEQLDPSTPRGLRDRALFELMYSSGLRTSEAARLTMSDLDLDRREIVVHGKGSCDRIVPISEVARDFLRRYIGDRLNRLEEPVFLGTHGKGIDKPMRIKEITRRFHTLLVKSGMDGPGRCAHAVRHSTATHLLDHGASVRHIQELLGHKHIDTTARYTQIQTDGLAKIYRRYHPGEHELFDTVDEAYEQRLEVLLRGGR